MSVQLYHGDCLDFMRTLEPGRVDCVVTDPPYGVGYSGRWNSDWREIENDNDAAWIAPVFSEIWRVMKADSLCVSFYGWPRADAFMSAWKAIGFKAVSHLIFLKNQIGLGYWTRGQHEQAYLLVKGSPAKPIVALSDVLSWTREDAAVHPTQKPIGAMKAIITRFTAEGQTVFDPFMGSGTTCVACVQSDVISSAVRLTRGTSRLPGSVSNKRKCRRAYR